MQDFQRLLNEIQSQKIAPFYLLCGTEPYFIDQLLGKLTSVLVDEQAAAFDHTVLYGKECTVAQIIENAKRFPMVAARQLVVVKEAQYMREDFEDLAAYVAQSSPTTVLVFCWKKAFDKRKKLYKAAQKSGVVFDGKPLFDNQIAPWISAQANVLELKIAPEAIRLLQEFVGSDLHRIEKALEKLNFAVPKGEVVVPDTIEFHIGISKEYNNFELQKAIGMRNFSQALKICNYMTQNQKNHPLVLTISSLHQFFERLMTYHALDNKQQAPQYLGISPYFVKEYQQAATIYPMKKCSQALKAIFDADLKSKGIKGNALSAETILKQLMIDLWT